MNHRIRTGWQRWAPALGAVSACLVLMQGELRAQSSLYWGPNGSGVPTGGSGTWNSTGSWTATPFTMYQSWPNDDHVAEFAGTAGTVVVSSTISATGLTFDTTGYTISGTTGGLLNLFASSSGFFGATFNVVGAGNTATISAPIVFSTSLYKMGAGTLITSGGLSAGGVVHNYNINQGGVTFMVASGTVDGGLRFLLGTAGSGGGGVVTFDNAGATGAKNLALNVLIADAGDGSIVSKRTAAQNMALTLGFNTQRTAGATLNYVVSGGVNGTENKISIANATGFQNQATFFNGTGFAWKDTGGYVRAINYGTDAGSLSSAGGTTIANTTHLQLTGALTTQNTGTFTTIKFSGSQGITMAANQILTVSGLLQAGGGTSLISGGTVRANSTAALRELVVRTDGASDALTISSIIANPTTGVTSLTKSGLGTLTLSGVNTYTGTTFLNGGVLSIGAMSALGSANTTTIQVQQGTLQYTGASASTTRNFNVGYGGGGLEVSGTANLTVTGAIAGTAGSAGTSDMLVKLGSGTLTFGGSGDNGGLSATVNAGVLQLAKTSSLVNAVTHLTVNNGGKTILTGSGTDQINDTGAVVVNAGGVLDLNGKNEGFETLAGGGLVTNNSSSTNVTLTLGAGDSGGPTGTFVYSDFSGTIANGSAGRRISVASNAIGTQVFSGNNTYTGATSIALTNTLQIGNGGTSGAVAGNIDNQGTLIFDRSNDSTYSGTITGNGFTKNGAGVLTLTANNSYSGTTILNAGGLTLGSSLALSTGAIIVNGGTIGAAGDLAINNAITLNSDVGVDVSGTSRLAYFGAISESGGARKLTKTGGGFLTMQTANAYTGGTVVRSGTLDLSATDGVGSGDIRVESGAVFTVHQDISLPNVVHLAGGVYERNLQSLVSLAHTVDATSALGGAQPDTSAALLDGFTTAFTGLETSFSGSSTAGNDGARQSNVYTLSGVPEVDGDTHETDMFVLQLTSANATGDSFLAWLDTDTNTWVNAVEGNIGGAAHFAGDGGYDSGLDFQLGWYGVDTATGSVWAVLNHNSDFAILSPVPEPATWALLGIAVVMGGWKVRRRLRLG